MPVPSGGSATINGIHYQMLWCLLETATLRLQNPRKVPSKDGPTRATLVLEPSRGGDALIRSEVEQVVQLKARSDGSTWSLHSLVHDVLPDLYRAVILDRDQEFVFVTEGRQGDWKEVESFFKRLCKSLPEEGQYALSHLDPGQKVQFLGALISPDGSTQPERRPHTTSLSEPELFEQIISVIRKHRDIAQDTETDRQRKLWRLLSRLKFRWEQTTTSLHERLLRHLRSLVDNPDTVEATLNSLLTALADRAINGNARVEADAFFVEHGIRGVPLGRRQWPHLVETAAEQLERDLERHSSYHATADVRPNDATLLNAPEVDVWRRGVASCLILHGQSGQGKTWRLSALAHSLSTETPVVVISGEVGARQIAEDAAHKFWFGLCNRHTPSRLDQIARRLQDTSAVPPQTPWLYLLVDGVHAIPDAQALYREIGSVEGVCWAFTASNELAERLVQCSALPNAAVVPVLDFSESELRRYVAGNDAAVWHDVPTDVRLVIRRPLLAQIYRFLAGESGWDAKNEYELYDRYFRRYLLDPLRDEGFAMAELPLVRAGVALWNGASYPWTARQLDRFGFSNGLIDALLRIGFLQRNVQDRFAIWHDRIKEWLVAFALADALETREQDIQEVGKWCRELLFISSRDPLPSVVQQPLLRYVPMDLLWQLAQRLAHDPTATDTLNTLFRQIEEEPTHYRAVEALYEELLPTLGAAIAPAVFRRLREVSGEEANWVKRNAMEKCLTRLNTEAVAPYAIALLEDEDEDLMRVGAQILQHRAAPQALPVLWVRYQALRQEANLEYGNERASQTTDDKRPKRNILWEQEIVRRALDACVPCDPDWLVDEIHQLPNPKAARETAIPADTLISLLCRIEDDGESWRQSKEVLRPWTEAENEELRIRCEGEFADAAYHWQDTDEVAWLRGRGNNDAWLIGPRCLRALARIAPDVALDALTDLPASQLAPTHKWCLNYLLARRPLETRAQLAELLQADKRHRWTYAETYSVLPEAMTTTALDCLLDELSGHMVAEGNNISTLWRKLDAVESITDLALLRCLWKRAGTEWETHYTKLLLGSGQAPGFHSDHRLEVTINVLFKVGGAGFTQAINVWLSAPEPFTRLNGGIMQAYLRYDEETARLLEPLALHSKAAEKDDASGIPIWHCRLAQKALGAIGAWKSLIRSVVSLAGNSHGDVINARVGLTPLSDDEMFPAIEALEQVPTHPGAILALGVGQRGDYIPQVLRVLNCEPVESGNSVTNACYNFLAIMPELPSDAIEALALRLPYTQCDWLVLPALMNSGSGSALTVLIEYLRVGLYRFGNGPYDWSDLGNVARVAKYLLRKPSAQTEAINLCRKRFCAAEILDGPAKQLVIALAPSAQHYPAVREALDCRQVQDFFLLQAFEPDGAIRHVGNKAKIMRGLAAYHQEDAYAASLRAVHNRDIHDRELAPYILLDLDTARAIPDLFAFLASGQAKLRMRHHIAQALTERVAGSDQTHAAMVRELLFRAAQSSNPRERSAACFVFGFLPLEEEVSATVNALMDDPNVTVFEAACAAWHRQDAIRRVNELTEAYLDEPDPARRWVLLETALEFGEPGESHRPVPNWLDRMAENLTPLQWDRVEEKLKKRCSKRDDELRREEEREERD